MAKKIKRIIVARLRALDIERKIRKPQPPTVRIHRSKKSYRRRIKFTRSNDIDSE